MAVRHYYNTDIDDAIAYFTSKKNGRSERTEKLRRLLREYKLFLKSTEKTRSLPEMGTTRIQVNVPILCKNLLDTFSKMEKQNEMNRDYPTTERFVRDYVFPVFFDLQRTRQEEIIKEAEDE